ncbi:hypothetical protein EDD11_003010 [Mortierella claussenii]|nr:hypothetical protein EDD11_003010 [Mortierella claussenii]
MKTLQAQVRQEDSGIRVWRFVLAQWKATVKSREQMRQCFKRGEVFVNGAVAEVTRVLATGDLVLIRYNEHAAHEAVYGREKLAVLYEDEDLAVVVKPSGKTMVAVGFMLPFSLSPSALMGDEAEQQPKGPQDMERDEQGASVEDSLGPVDADDDEDDGRDSDQSDIPINISPTLGQQHRFPCAIHGLEKASSGLILVAKTPEMRSALLQMHRDGDIRKTFRVICHGAWMRSGADMADSTMELSNVYDADSIIPLDLEGLGAEYMDVVRVVKVSLSNEAGHLSTLDISPRSPAMGINVRRYMMSIQHPVVGDSGNTKPLKANRNKGLLSALIKVEFVHPKLGTRVLTDMAEPDKFEQLRIREQKAHVRRLASDQEELMKGGLDPISTYDRASDQPIAYMVGEKDFYGMRFKVSPATLIPRSSTETLVQAAIAFAQDRPVKILDVGTGSGCLLLAILSKLSAAVGVGIDISERALDVARMNSLLHGLDGRASFQPGDLGKLESLPEVLQPFDVLVCNPPYLDSSKAIKLTKLFTGTAYEPPEALFATNEGYGAYELLGACLLRDLSAPDHHRVVTKNGCVILEIGAGMGMRVREIFSFLRFERALKDKQDSERCLVFTVPSSLIVPPCVDVRTKGYIEMPDE